jgi:hypothetical protein
MPVTGGDGHANARQQAQVRQKVSDTVTRGKCSWITGMKLPQAPKILITDTLLQAGPWGFSCGTDRGFGDGLGGDFGQRIEEILGRSEPNHSFDCPIEAVPVVGFTSNQGAVHIEYD